jgi:hypothetical protein
VRPPSVIAVSTPNPDRNEQPPVDMVEPSSWWPFVAAVLGAISCYATLTVVLILDATNSTAWGLIWMVIPTMFFVASAAALFVGSGLAAHERLAAVRAGFFGYSPRDRPRRGSVSPNRLVRKR